MDRITDILVPYDFSAPSRLAVDYAVNFVGSRPDKRITLCFMQEQEDREALEAEFKSIQSGLGKAFQGRMDYIHFSPPSVAGFIKESQSRKPDLIIMGTSGSQDPDGNTHTSETVLAMDCPVMVVPKGVSEEFQIKKIALVLGRSEIDDPNDLATLLDVCRTFNARVHVLTIETQPGTYGYSEGEEHNEELLEYYLEDFYSHHVFIQKEDLVQGIFDYVAEKEIDVISVLPRNHVKKGTPSEGRLTRILAMQTHTPLLAIEH